MPNKISPVTLKDYDDCLVHNALINNIKRYLILRSRKYSVLDPHKKIKPHLRYQDLMQFNTNEGVCSGLVSFRLYSIRAGKEGHFTELFDYVYDWQDKQYLASNLIEDPLMEEFINIVFFLHADSMLRPGVLQTDWRSSFGLMLTDQHVVNEEFNSTFAFDAESLHALLKQITKSNKMLRFGNGLHSVGLILYNDHYHFYNPSVKPEIVPDLEHAAEAVIGSLKWQTDGYQVLNIRAFDLEDSCEIEYPSKLELYTQLMQKIDSKRFASASRYIFHLAAKNLDITTLEFLRQSGFVYKPWVETINTEVHQAITDYKIEMLDYLLSIGLPVNFARADSLTPLGLAVNYDNFEMVCMLLAAGADPNLDIDNAIKDYTAIEFALAIKADKDIIAVLLGHGAKLTERVRQIMKKIYTADEQALIHANAEIVRTEQQIYHEKTRIYHFLHDSPRALNFWQLRALLQDLKHILPIMLAKPLQQQTHSDLIELRTILLTLDYLTQTRSLNPISKLIAASAKKAKRQIEEYLQANGVAALDSYLALHPAVKRQQAGVYFATMGTETTPLAYANSVFQLLKL